jgi:hypothetical protein
MAKQQSEDDPRVITFISILKAIETEEVFSYNLNFEALAVLLTAHYSATFDRNEIPLETKEKFTNAYTDACLSYLKQRLKQKAIKACQELLAESVTFAHTFVLQSAGAPASLVNKSKISAKTFEAVLIASRKSYIAPLKEHFLRGHIGSEADYDLTDLSSNYQPLLDKWQLAKDDAKRDQKHSVHKQNWRERLDTYQLPDDLIEWLNLSESEKADILSQRTDLPHLQEKLAKGYALVKPSEIALEHAARLCGADPYYYSVSHLFRLLKNKK